MPIYNFLCQSCGAPYRELILGSEAPTCPECQSHAAEKQLSTFAVGSGAPELPPPASGCGTCGDPRGPGSCSA